MGEWHVSRDGETFGPFTFERMTTAAREGELRREDFVWTEGMETWRIAGSVAGLFAPPPLPVRPSSSAATARKPIEDSEGEVQETKPLENDHAPSPEPSTARKRNNFLIRHWNGELSLVASYWGVGVLLSFGVVLLISGLAEGVSAARLSPSLRGIFSCVLISFAIAFTVWALVGVWRSAGNYMTNGGRVLWGALARLVVVIGVFRAGLDFVQVTGPVFVESWRRIFAENIPPHDIRLMRGGTEIELAGGMNYGTADAFKRILDAAPAVRLVHLNSSGGWISEGHQVHQILRDRRLPTYTSTDCVSACTIAFLGGHERYLATKARLGFHSSSIGNVDQSRLPEVNADVRATLKMHGVPSAFIEKALGTSLGSMWYPSAQELISAKIVTRVVDPAQFGLSGISNWRDEKAMEDGLLSIPVYATLRDNDPIAYKQLAARWLEGVKLGKSVLEIRADIEGVFAADVLPKYLQTGPDAALLRYWRSMLAEMNYLRNKDAALCYAFLFPEARSPSFNLHGLLPEALWKEDIDALANLIRQTHLRPAILKMVDTDADMVAIYPRLIAIHPNAADILAEPAKFSSQTAIVCSLMIGFYAEILKFPQERAATVLRNLMAK